MTDKNPYENHDQIDIPDFSSIKPREEDIDRSIFKMSDDEDTYQEEDDEEYYDDEEEGGLTPRKSTVVVGCVVLVLLLVLAIFGIVWGISKNKAYTNLKSEYDTYKTTTAAQITELNNKITELQTQISSSTTNNSTSDSTSTSGDTYKVTAESGINVRTGPSTSYDRVSYSSLSSDLQSALTNDDGNAKAANGASLKVLEIVNDSDSDIGSDCKWGKLADNVYVVINYYGEDWASKQ